MVPELKPSPDPTLREKLRGLRAYLATEIRGQEHVFDAVCSVLVRGELGLAHPSRPKGSFLFLGPTGVGKTETTKAFTRYLLGTEPISFDMPEYQNQIAVEKLLGEHRDDPGLLGRALRGITGGTLLFDEVEKAHSRVLDLFLQILEEARITLATGETLDLRGFYVVLTSNVGSAEIMHMVSSRFASIERTVLMRAREQWRPEFLGRITEKIVFNRLDYAAQRAICTQQIAREGERLRALGYAAEVDPITFESLVREGYHRTLGARPMRNVVERRLQEAVAITLLTS